MLENFYDLSLTHNRNYFVRKILSVRVFLNFLKDAPFGAKNKHFPLLSHPLGFLKLREKNVPWIVFTRSLAGQYKNVYMLSPLPRLMARSPDFKIGI